MPDKKLLSIAEISRLLDVPESTLHYWKNRFAQYLPSSGQNRLKRFRPEAVEAFRLIASMLKQGHTAEDVMSELSRRYPVNVTLTQDSSSPEQESSPAQARQLNIEPAIQIAAAMGSEIARSINEGFKELLAGMPPSTQFPEEMKKRLESTVMELGEQEESIETIKSENEQLRQKLAVMEAELIRLRKDRREMEKYLLDKLKAVTK